MIMKFILFFVLFRCVQPFSLVESNDFDLPLNQKPKISDDKFATEDEVSKESSVESSGDIIDDTEPSIETTSSSIDTTELDFDVSSSAKKQKCIFGTNKVCTPFTYEGVNYHDCYLSWYGSNCMVNGEWFYCGECTENTTIADDKFTSVSDVEDTTVSTTEVSKEISIESSGDYNDDTEQSIESTDGNNDDTELDGQLDVLENAKKQKCVQGTDKVCTPFTYNGVNYDDCYSGYWSFQCLVDGEWSNCGECTEDSTISDVEVTTFSTEEEDIVSKETSVESSGDIIDDTETSLETTDGNIDDNEFDGQLDVPTSSKKQKCVQGTNKICTPFTYNGVNYDDCYSGYWSFQCLVGSEWSYCGDCTEDSTISDDKSTSVSDVKVTTTSNVEYTTISIEEDYSPKETPIENSGDYNDDTEISSETEEDINDTEPSIETTGKPIESTTELDELLDVAKSTKKQKCVEGTNYTCTPFVYRGVNYDDCATGRWNGDWCLIKTQDGKFYPSSLPCGECIEQL